MYRKNAQVLYKKVQTKALIRPVAFHRKANGTMDVEGNLTLWNEQMEDFIRTPLWKSGSAPGYDGRDALQPPPYLVYVPCDHPNKADVTLLIAHGGGFETRTGCEGINTAWYFHERGYDTAILSYRLKPFSRLDAMADMHRAVRILRCNCSTFGCSDKVGVMGFSAGAMLSANCATHFDHGDSESSDPVERFSNRPDMVVMGYGAFSAVSYPHMFDEPPLREMWGRDLAEQIYLAPEKNITADTPPFFIWQTLSDDGRYGMTLAKELNDRRIPYELHIFDEGVHGMAMADGENDLDLSLPHVHHWGELCDEWLRKTSITVRTDA